MTKNLQKNAKFYECKKCAFISSNRRNYEVHLTTRKHREMTLNDEKLANLAKMHVCECGNSYKYRQGLGSTGAYQVSGRPYITGSVVEGAAGSGAEEVHIRFPNVVKSLTFACTGASGTACRFHFDSIKDSSNVGGHQFPLLGRLQAG